MLNEVKTSFFEGLKNKKFMKKAALASVVFVGLAITAMQTFGARYAIMIDPQVDPCIPGVNVFLVDKEDRTPERGKMFALKAMNIEKLLAESDPATEPMRSYYEDGRLLIKMMDGMPGDTVEVGQQHIEINGEVPVGGGLMLVGTLKKEPAYFEREVVLAEKKYFMMGRTVNSFDSRYWGAVDESQIVGRAIALF